MTDPPATGTRLPAIRTRRGRKQGVGDTVFHSVSWAFAMLLVASFVYLLVILAQEAWPSIRAFGANFFFSDTWDPPGQRFGAFPYVFGTFTSSILALVVALPVSIGAAISLVSLLPRSVSRPIGILIELLAAVPSIVFGVWGFAVILPFVRMICPAGSFGPSLLAAGFVLAVMILPILTSLSRDMIRAVPVAQREAALALGATPWEVTWHVVLPNAKSGIVAAVILAFGRAFGETMAVIMVIGNQVGIPKTVCGPASTMAGVIANEFGDPSGPLHFAALVEIGLVLLVVSLFLSVLSRLLIRYLARRLGGKVA